MGILVAGLTPADQRTLLFDRFVLGEVNRATESFWSLSGKTVNVAVGLATLGVESSRLIVPLGGERLDRFREELDTLGVQYQIVQTRSVTRTCTTMIDRATGTVTELVENAPPLEENELAEFERLFLQNLPVADLLVLSGTIPQNCPPTIFRRLAAERYLSCRVVADLQGKVLYRLLESAPFLVKPNREELARTLERDLSDDEVLLDSMQQLNRRGARWVLVTDGPRTLWLTSEIDTYRFQSIPVSKEEIVNPIGCGDSLTAGIVWSLDRGDSMLEAVKFGIAAAVINLRQMLPARLDAAEVEKLASQVDMVEYG